MPAPAKSPKKTGPSGADIVAEARSLLGVPYLYGGTDPHVGLDCSGLVLVVCQRLGINCPRTSEEQFAWGIPVDTPSPGDLAFFIGSPIDPPPGHEGIVVSPGRMIDAPFSGTVVRYDAFSTNGTGVNGFMGYRRIPHTTQSFSANSNIGTSGAAINAGQNPARPASIAGAAVGSIFAYIIVALIAIGILIALLLLGGVLIAGG
jgi:hypothetical protein